MRHSPLQFLFGTTLFTFSVLELCNTQCVSLSTTPFFLLNSTIFIKYPLHQNCFYSEKAQSCPFSKNRGGFLHNPFFHFSCKILDLGLVIVMRIKKICCLEWIVLCSLLLAALVSSKNHGNPANDLVDIINKNRTALKLPQLSNTPGLGCMALQYVKQCKGNCSSGNTLTCQPSEDDFAEVFAPNCGVELPTFGTISGRIVVCQHKYLEPSEAFASVIVQNAKTLSLVRNRTHTEVGVGIIGHKHKGPYFWCVLFSNSQRNTSFVLEDLGEGIKQKKGCSSGTSNPCSTAHKNAVAFRNHLYTIVFLCIYFLQQFF